MRLAIRHAALAAPPGLLCRFLRGELAHSVELRHVPDLEFRVDTAFEEGSKVDRILASPEVRRDLGDVRKRGGSDA